MANVLSLIFNPSSQMREKYENEYRRALIEDITQRLHGTDPASLALYFDEKSTIVHLESVRIALLDPEELDAQMILFAERYEAVAGCTPPIAIPNVAEPEKAKRAWLKQTSWEGYRLHSSNRGKYSELGTHIGVFSRMVFAMVLSVIGLFFIIDWLPNTYLVPPFVLAMLAGSVGGSINHLRLLTSPKLPKGTEILSYELELLGKSAIGTALAGALFGMIIHIIAASGIVAVLGEVGKILPNIDKVQVGSSEDWINLNTQAGLRTIFLGRPPTQDFAKLLVWCFASGFIPNLVPDIVDSLYRKKKSTN